jgi:hypothetical protein
MDKTTYIERVKEKIGKEHGCQSSHIESTVLQEHSEDQRPWNNHVETFKLIGCIAAERCFAWAYGRNAQGDDLEIIIVLASPEIDGPEKAFQHWLSGLYRRGIGTELDETRMEASGKP